MSGLFQRIARRRAGDPDETSAPNAADHVGADAPTADTQPAADSQPAADAPTRYIGAPPPGGDSASQTPATPRPVPPAVAAQSTELFAPVTEQPTVSQPSVPDQPAPDDSAAPAEGAPAEGAPAEGAPAEGAPADGVPANGAQAEGAVAQAAEGEQADAPAPAEERRPGFRERGRMRRRLRYLRRLRELQVRDLGGLAFDLRRFERKRDDLVAQKIDQIRACDDELRALEEALEDRRDIRDVRAPGIGGACPRCFALYGSNDRFCSHCGAALGGLAQGPAQVAAPPPAPPQPAPAQLPTPPPAQLSAPPPAQLPAPPAAPAAPPAGGAHEPTPPQ